MIGRPLSRHLLRRGYDVRVLVRRTPSRPNEVAWDPDRGHLDPTAVDGSHAVINLGGAGVGDRRWTTAYKQTILHSRLDGTALIASTAASVEQPPKRLLQASAVGFYGDRGDDALDETAHAGTGFLANVVRRWENAAGPAREAGVPVVHLRSGLVLTPRGGAAGRMLPLFRLGLGGRLGSGRQWWPWITLVDEVRAILHLLDSTLTGPVNLTGPQPARNADVTQAMAQALRRPAILPVPAIALRLALGEFASDILASQRVVPAALTADGFSYRHRTIADATRWLVS